MSDLLDVTAQENVIPEADAPPPSLGSVLDAALERSQAQPPEVPPVAPATSTEAPADSGRQRDAQGRFLPKDDAQAQLPLAPATQGVTPPATPATPPVAPQFNEAPQSWKAEMRPQWEKVPQEVRGYLHQREQELQHGFQAVAHRGKVAEAVLNEFVPYAEQLQAEGATPVAAIRTLLQTAYQLRNGGSEFKKAIILSLADQYGVDLNSPLNRELAQAQAQATSLQTERMYSQSNTIQQVQNQVDQEFAAFANDPQNEFFPQVRHIMLALVQNNVARNMQSAYDMALGMDPNIRKILIDREYNNRVAAERAAAAKSVSIKGTPNGAGMRQNPPQGESLRGTLERLVGES